MANSFLCDELLFYDTECTCENPDPVGMLKRVNAVGHGRRLAKDPRDYRYPISVPSAKRVTQKTWSSDGVLDQGSTSQCVAFSGMKYLTTAPINNRPPFTPLEIYTECLKVDEFSGEDVEGGTTVRALFKVLRRRGYVAEYRWAFDAETVINYLLTTGPVVVGTLWNDELSNPDAHGYISPGPNIKDAEDGHAWCLIGANRSRYNPDRTRGAVRMINSWGDRWGPHRGRAWVTFADLDLLIKTNGEACVATEVLRRGITK